ncbi:MAG TPA: LuxR C-terminal-related transcriptional regulator [Flavisolibacter sp.]|jgi:DNA-binding NarL/FixJ family response regulator
MGITNWLKHTKDTDLQHAAHEKIRQFQEIEQHIPGVIIIHNLADDSIVYLSERGRKFLNVSLEEIRLPHFDYHKRFFNPEDVPNYAPKILGMIQRNADDEIITFFQQVRASKKSDWMWFSSSIKILLRDKENKPLLAVTIAVPIDAAHYFTPKIERLIQENTFLREKQAVFACLSKREKEVLRLLALGHNSNVIGEELHISEATVKTHRKNIRSKLNAESSFDLMQFAQAFNLV